MVGSLADQLWKLEFNEALAPEFESDDLSFDGDSTLALIALIASLETLAMGHYNVHAHSTPVHLASADPPFAVGDEIICDTSEGRVLKAFVLEAEHPRCLLRLEDSTIIIVTSVTPM